MKIDIDVELPDGNICDGSDGCQFLTVSIEYSERYCTLFQTDLKLDEDRAWKTQKCDECKKICE
jgi:hypothetical protein